MSNNYIYKKEILLEKKGKYIIDILRTFKKRYFYKIYDKRDKRNIEETNEQKRGNIQRCEYLINFNYNKLMNKYLNFLGGNIIDQLIFSNILSNFLLDISIYHNEINYIDINKELNQSVITFITNYTQEEKIIGILITIDMHVCCCFLCNGNWKYYNDNDKIIYDCDILEILKQKEDNNSLYIKKNSIPEFLSNEYPIDKNNYDKVLSITILYK